VLAAYGAGIYKDFYKAVDTMTRLVGRVEPNMANHDLYNKWMPIYEDVYKSLLGTYDKATQIQ